MEIINLTSAVTKHYKCHILRTTVCRIYIVHRQPPHPGPVQSNLTRELGIPGPIMWVLNRVVFKPVQYGTWPDIPDQDNGSYLVPLAKFEPRLPHAQCYDDEFGVKVWEWNMAAMKTAGAD
ncbi:Uncharacterized protein TCAP_03978 [Tolypocladium capitatum]|uniref:Uncharacterized protein n=1 Tax=Tolypocladium capitatum TaxID=45235 RepID=A0A2K3QEX1_9HYPO|nr:Uncharacterized protein TCAP_03978 [Tolypocladium capitatum]